MKMLEEMERFSNEHSGRYYYDEDGGMSNRNSYRRRDSMGRYMDNGSYRRSYEDGFQRSRYPSKVAAHDGRS